MQLVAMYTGHLYKLAICSTDQYRFRDLAAEIPEHLLLDCPITARIKSQYIGAVNPLRTHVISISPGELLSYESIYSFNNIFKYNIIDLCYAIPVKIT